MKKLAIATVLALGLTVVPATAAVSPARETEGCQVLNPAQSSCSYTATHEASSPVSGIFGWGSWVVKIKVGKKTETYKSPSTGEPTAHEIVIPEGAKVSMKALTPGSGGTVGHAD